MLTDHIYHPGSRVRNMCVEGECQAGSRAGFVDAAEEAGAPLRDRGAMDGGATLNLILEVSGEARKDKAAKVALARSLWVPAVNNHGGFGWWAFLEINDPWDAQGASGGHPRDGATSLASRRQLTGVLAEPPAGSRSLGRGGHDQGQRAATAWFQRQSPDDLPRPALLHPQPPSDAPSTGKIAVKVINHYGDEVLKVYAT